MTKNVFELEFASIYTLINSTLTPSKEKELKKLLLKLNNPNFYSKFTRTHPMAEYGYYKKKTINPLLISLKNMLNVLRDTEDSQLKLKQLQIEFSWAYHNYQKSIGFFKNTTIVN
jgi:hypothetical protein